MTHTEGSHSNLCATDQSAEEGQGRGGGWANDVDIKEDHNNNDGNNDDDDEDNHDIKSKCKYCDGG